MPIPGVSSTICSVTLSLFVCLTRTHIQPVPIQTPKPVEPQQDTVLRLTTELVTLNAQVVNKETGAIVNGLKAEDFELYEDGVKQRLEYFGADHRPLSIVLLFDYTSTVLPVIEQLAERAEQALQHLKLEDEVAVLAFTEEVQVLQGFTSDRTKVAEAIRRAGELRSRSSARSFLNEGVYQAAARLGEVTNRERRRVIVLLNDGLGNVDFKRRKHSEKEALAEAFEAETTICGVVIKSLMTYEIEATYVPFETILGAKNPAGRTHSYAEKTGGEVVAGNKEKAAEKLAEIFDRLRTCYLLGYISKNTAVDGKFRRIKLRLIPQAERRVGEVVIKTRQGYYPHSKASAP